MIRSTCTCGLDTTRAPVNNTPPFNGRWRTAERTYLEAVEIGEELVILVLDVRHQSHRQLVVRLAANVDHVGDVDTRAVDARRVVQSQAV